MREEPDTVEVLLRDGRGYHDTQSERLAGEMEAAIGGPIAPHQWRPFIDLANHTIGEHLRDWPRARALAERVLGGETPDAASAPAWGKLAAARFLAGDASGAIVAELAYAGAAGDLRAALVDCRVGLASAMLGSKRVAEATAIYEAAIALADADATSPADRGIAVASNNLASELLESAQRTPDEDALMRRAAGAALVFWKKCGTWVNEERALYLLALVANALGAPAEALRRIDAALALIEANGEEAVDVAFLRLARADAHARLGDAEAHRRDLEVADTAAALWEQPPLKAWFSDERAKIHKLQG